MKKIVSVLLIVFLLIGLTACSENVDIPEYEVYSSEELNDDIVYRVIIDKETEPEALQTAAMEITKNDGCDTNTVWFYSSVKDIEVFGAYTVAMAEEYEKNRFIITSAEDAIVQNSKKLNDESFNGYTFGEPFTDIRKIELYNGAMIGLKNDGTVVSDGFDVSIQKKIELWDEVIDIQMSGTVIVALKSDGTIESISDFSTEAFKNIKAIENCGDYVAGLSNNGTVHIAGEPYCANLNGFSVNAWTDVIKIEGSYDFLVGLKSDGTVLATGDNMYSQLDYIAQWENIVDIVEYEGNVVGLKHDGTVVFTGDDVTDNFDFSNWKDIEKVFMGYDYVVGLKDNGMLYVTGKEKWVDFDEVRKWEGIVDIEFSATGIAGITKAGDVLLTDADNARWSPAILLWGDVVDIIYGYDLETDMHIWRAIRSNGEVLKS